MTVLKQFLLVITLILNTVVLAVTPKEAYQLTEEGRAVIVDVRELDEIAHGMILDALWFPKSRMDHDPKSVGQFKKVIEGKRVFLYCKSGKRAAACSDVMKNHGIDAESIGGYEELKNELPVEGLHQKLNKLHIPD